MTTIYFDGGCKPNPGTMECAVVCRELNIRQHQVIGYGTNNEAEWLAFLWACETALSQNLTDVTISGDSNLVILQALGEWKVKHELLKPFKEEFLRLKPRFTNLKLVHVRRERNPAGHYIESLY